MSEQNKVSGGCLCGSVRYECDRDAAVGANHCHCRDCQRSTGSGFTTFFVLPDAAMEVSDGTLGSYTNAGESGRTITRYFCPNCGSPIFSTAEVFPNFRFVKAGSLDDPSWVKPDSVYWASSAQPWAPCDDSITLHPHNPG